MTIDAEHRATTLTVGIVAGLILLTSPGVASAQEPTGPSGEPCAPFHGDPPAYRLGVALERAVQRLMRPMSDGTQRSPRAISAALRRTGFNVGYADRPRDVPPNRQAVVREGTNLTTTMLVRTILLVSGLQCADGSVRYLPGNSYSAPNPVRAASRIRLVPVGCLAQKVARPAQLPRAYLAAARSLLRSRQRSPATIAALLTRRGFPTLPVPTVHDMPREGLSLLLDRSSRRRLTVGYRRVICTSTPGAASELVTRLRSIR